MSNTSTALVIGTPDTFVQRLVAGVVMALIMTLGMVAVEPAEAQAAPIQAGVSAQTTAVALPSSTTRPGRGFGQVDVLLDGCDMQRVAGSGYWTGLSAATVICWQSGIGGRVLILGVCQAAIQTCALRAWFHHKWAGMTATFWGNWWCWEY